MEDILAIVLIFGGGTAVLLAFSPIGRALADRIRHRDGLPGPDPAVHEELARLRDDVAELQERLDSPSACSPNGASRAGSRPIHEVADAARVG